MFSEDKKTDFYYCDLAKYLIKFLEESKNCKLLLLFDSCKSNQIWMEISNILPKERLEDISFIGYKNNGHLWKIADNRCHNLGGILHLIFQNSIAQVQDNNNLKFDNVFMNEAEKMIPLLNFS